MFLKEDQTEYREEKRRQTQRTLLWSFMGSTDSTYSDVHDVENWGEMCDNTPREYCSDEDSDSESLSPFSRGLHRVTSLIGLSSRSGSSPRTPTPARRSSSFFSSPSSNNSLWARLTPPILGLSSNSNTISTNTTDSSRDGSRSNTPFFDRLFGVYTNNNSNQGLTSPTNSNSATSIPPRDQSPKVQKSVDKTPSLRKGSQSSSDSPNATTQEITPTLDNEPSSPLLSLPRIDDGSHDHSSEQETGSNGNNGGDGSTSHNNNSSDSSSSSEHYRKLNRAVLDYEVSTSGEIGAIYISSSPTSVLQIDHLLPEALLPTSSASSKNQSPHRKRAHSDQKPKRKIWKKKELRRLRTALSDSVFITETKDLSKNLKSDHRDEQTKSNSRGSDACAVQ